MTTLDRLQTRPVATAQIPALLQAAVPSADRGFGLVNEESRTHNAFFLAARIKSRASWPMMV